MMIGGAGEDFLGAVDLLGDNKTGDLVRKDEIGEAPEEVGFVADGGREAVGAADDDGDIFAIYESAVELGGEVGGREVGAAFVGQNDIIVAGEGPSFEIFEEFWFFEKLPFNVVRFFEAFFVFGSSFDKPRWVFFAAGEDSNHNINYSKFDII